MSNQVEDWLTRCEAFAIDVLEKHGEPTTWPGYAQVENDEKKSFDVRRAASILLWVSCCREDIAKHGEAMLNVIYRAVQLSQKVHAADIRMGRRTRAGLDEGRARANKDKGSELYPQYRARYESLRKKGCSITESTAMAASLEGVHVSTIRRARKNK